ncbi:hypothetical protein CUJ83_04210 [Methanocella sp. CWC-04]|uniref:Uncharacterized protein n=1 Tax=Methanooceanicella nereidis TaxID=2052831 RepID=A0AAP2RB78_9EURY|nr:hypothetical protein [Methanocella sp. CWC-04]
MTLSSLADNRPVPEAVLDRGQKTFMTGFIVRTSFPMIMKRYFLSMAADDEAKKKIHDRPYDGRALG